MNHNKAKQNQDALKEKSTHLNALKLKQVELQSEQKELDLVKQTNTNDLNNTRENFKGKIAQLDDKKNSMFLTCDHIKEFTKATGV